MYTQGLSYIINYYKHHGLKCALSGLSKVYETKQTLFGRSIYDKWEGQAVITQWIQNQDSEGKQQEKSFVVKHLLKLRMNFQQKGTVLELCPTPPFRVFTQLEVWKNPIRP